MRGSLESVQVKFSTIGKKVQFTILLENSEQDFRLLMNDLSNLLKRKNVWRGTIQITTEVENVDVNHKLKSCCGPFFIGKNFQTTFPIAEYYFYPFGEFLWQFCDKYAREMLSCFAGSHDGLHESIRNTQRGKNTNKIVYTGAAARALGLFE